MYKFNIKKTTQQKYKDVLTSIISNYEKETGINNIKILDVGAGNCWLLNLLPSYIKIGIDLHEHHHFIDNNFESFLKSKKSGFAYADATKIPFHDAVFDFVISNEFISHVNDIDYTLHEQIRVLKKGGRLLIMDSNPFNFLAFFTCFFINYFTSDKKIKRGGLKWLFHRDEPFYEFAPTKSGKRLVCWKDENIHSKYWWRNKLKPFSDHMEFNVSNFWSFPPIKSFSFFANKIMIIGRKK